MVERFIQWMAVEQPTKIKLDWYLTSVNVECYTANNVIVICDKTLREWRKMTGDVLNVDLKSAYLQI